MSAVTTLAWMTLAIREKIQATGAFLPRVPMAVVVIPASAMPLTSSRLQTVLVVRNAQTHAICMEMILVRQEETQATSVFEIISRTHVLKATFVCVPANFLSQRVVWLVYNAKTRVQTIHAVMV